MTWKNYKDNIESQFSIKLPYLSMGMSGDFEEAIIEGYQMPDPDIKKHDFIKIPYSEIKD